MDPLFFLFTLCLSYSGGEDCSFTWGIEPIENPHYAGYMDPDNRIVIAEDMKNLLHEIEHVICYLTYPESMELYQCYQQTDTRDIMAQVRNPVR